MLGILIGAVACTILLFAIGFYYFSKEQKGQEETKIQNTLLNKNIKHPVETKFIRVKRYIQDKFFFDILIETAAVFIGAILAMACTDMYDTHQAQKASIASLGVASEDMYAQTELLEGGIMQYQNGNIDIETLRLNAPLDTSLVKPSAYDTYIIETLKKGPYSILLQIYRDIGRTNTYLESDRLASDAYVVGLCENLVEDSKFLSELLDQTKMWYEKNVTDIEFEEWFDNYFQRFYEAKDKENFVINDD